MKCNPPSKKVVTDPEALLVGPLPATSEGSVRPLPSASHKLLCQFSFRILHVNLLSVDLATFHSHLP